jgi:adenylate kinase
VRLVILGGSGSGKSTQGQRLCRQLEIPLISTGEILREAMSTTDQAYAQSPHSANTSEKNLGCQAQQYLEKGELVPDEMMIELMQHRLQQSDFYRGWILEGYPRTAFQAEELDFLLNHLGQKLDWAIYLQVPEAIMVNRSLGRTLYDDQAEIVHRRIELFYERTIPILEYYDRRRHLLTIDGDLSPDIVQQNIINLLGVP